MFLLLDDPDVVKGRAGLPYAVEDYYNVNPGFSQRSIKRLEEFEALIARTHDAGMKSYYRYRLNHIARKYEGKITYRRKRFWCRR
jgi:glycosidase